MTAMGQPLTGAPSTTKLSSWNTIIEHLDDSEFRKKFHHSEQGILNPLEDEKYLTTMLEKIMRDHPHLMPVSTKVLAVILELHSTYPCCANCTVALLGSLNVEADLFAGKLKTLLLKKNFLLPKNRPLSFIARVSSSFPNKDQAIEPLHSVPLYLKEITTPVLLHRVSGALGMPAGGVSRSPFTEPSRKLLSS